MDFSSYKAFLFDVDKTLTNSKKEITPRTQEMVQKLYQKYPLIGVCTGRHFVTLRSVAFPYFPSDCVHVVAGGAQVIKTDGTVLWEKLIPAQTVQEIIRFAKERNVGVVIQTGTSFFANEKKLEGWLHNPKSTIVPLPLADFPNTDVPLVVVDDINEEIGKELKHSDLWEAKVMHHYDGSWYADVTAHGVNKSVGVREWCTIQGIKPEEVIGFGDSETDIEFLQTVGYAVAAGNATEAVKKVADEVCGDYDHDGVAEWINTTILE
ncbi:MAG: HAD hydrolase family protein [Candidatus Woesebacteria bacterium]